MRETDESRADLQTVNEYMTNAAKMLGQVLDAAADGTWRPDPADVRGALDGFRGILDNVEAQLLARIPSVRP